MTRKQYKWRVLAVVTMLAVGISGTQVFAADPSQGAKLYSMHCSSCHGVRGQGEMPGVPNFSRGEGLFQPDTALVTLLEEGRGIMPAYRGLMSTQELLDVIAYLRTLH